MPELRRDPVVGRWVIISKERGKRPSDFVIVQERIKGGYCPLCPGNEHSTPPEVLVYSSEESGRPLPSSWALRVVPNKYPALTMEGQLDKRREGIYEKLKGVGAHEVIIETPIHDETLASMPTKQIELIFKSYKARIQALSQDNRFKFIMIFKNFGQAAGASLEHSHSQLIALPVIPLTIQQELSGSMRHFDLNDKCIFCDMIRQERSQNLRIVCENNEFITFCPFAPRSPFEMWCMPKDHTSSYEDISEPQIESLANLFSETMKRLDRALPKVPYNIMLHTAPIENHDVPYYHWHLEIKPKLTMQAGFEWGTGFYINPTPPEESARFLKEIDLNNQGTSDSLLSRKERLIS